MKKLSQVLVAIVLSVGFVGIGGVANVQAEECDVIIINGTGPGSENIVECEVELDVEVVCENNIYVLNESSQEAVSGEVEEQGNTTGGAAVSGNATNENGTVVEIGAACGEVPVTPENPVTPEQPVTPAAVTPKVTKLPNTSSSSIVEIALVVIASAAAVLVASRAALAAYRRASLK